MNTTAQTASSDRDSLWSVTILRNGSCFLTLPPMHGERAARERACSEIIGRTNDVYYPGDHQWSAEIGIIGLPILDTLVPCAQGGNAVMGADNMCPIHGSEAWLFEYEDEDDDDDDW